MNARLLAAAALLHVAIVVLFFAAGRMQLAPHVIKRDGIGPASDSLAYQPAAVELATTLRRHGFGGWRLAAAPVHVRIVSLVLALLPALSGYGIVAAEPLNLICYLAVVSLTFAIGREIGGRRSGLIAAAMIALCPSFVFHTTQFLKDPLFIAGTLAVVFTVVTWLTRTYDWKSAAAAGLGMTAGTVMLLLIRSKFAVVILALSILGATLLVARQVIEKRLIGWNLTCALATLAMVALMLSQSTHTYQKVKAYPSPAVGEPKSITGGKQLRTLVSWQSGGPAALALSSVRERYIMSDGIAASGIDDNLPLRNAADLAAYAPRAAAIGLWAPFPGSWFQRGREVGSAGRFVAGAETLIIYVLELLTIPALVFPPRRMPSLLLALFVLLGVTMLGMVVTNVGTLFRFRYPFWILLIVTGVSGARKLARAWPTGDRRAAAAVVACVSLLVCSCAHPARPDLTITNFTGTTIDALYLSPSHSTTWQENVLGRDVLRDGDTTAIRIDSRVPTPLWDLRVDAGPYRAEWLRLDRTKISAIALRLGKDAVVAEVR